MIAPDSAPPYGTLGMTENPYSASLECSAPERDRHAVMAQGNATNHLNITHMNKKLNSLFFIIH
jgi:hypothetical protein